MPIKLHDLLPDEISDECAYHVVNFFTHLTQALESRYYCQLKRYASNNTPSHLPAFLEDEPSHDNDF